MNLDLESFQGVIHKRHQTRRGGWLIADQRKGGYVDFALIKGERGLTSFMDDLLTQHFTMGYPRRGEVHMISRSLGH